MSGINTETHVFQRECSQRTNWPSTDRPSFAAANQVVTLTRVTNERVASCNCVNLLQVSSVHVLWTNLSSYVCVCVCVCVCLWLLHANADVRAKRALTTRTAKVQLQIDLPYHVPLYYRLYRVSQKSEPLNILQQRSQICPDLNKIPHTQDDIYFCHRRQIS